MATHQGFFFGATSRFSDLTHEFLRRPSVARLSVSVGSDGEEESCRRASCLWLDPIHHFVLASAFVHGHPNTRTPKADFHHSPTTHWLFQICLVAYFYTCIVFSRRIQILHIMYHAVSFIGTAGVAAVAVLSLLPDANAFAPNARPAFSSSRHTTAVPLYSELERVKSAGGGTGVAFPVGDFHLFDPEAEGKLQGTGSLSQRIQAGADFVPPPTHPDGTYLASGDGVNGAAGVESSPPEGAVAMDAQHWLEHLDDNLPVNFAKPNAPAMATLLARQVSLCSCNTICCELAVSHIPPVTYLSPIICLTQPSPPFILPLSASSPPMPPVTFSTSSFAFRRECTTSRASRSASSLPVPTRPTAALKSLGCIPLPALVTVTL